MSLMIYIVGLGHIVGIPILVQIIIVSYAHIVPIARLEAFRPLKASKLEAFRGLKPYSQIGGF